VFGYYWSIVVSRPINEHTRTALAAVGSIVAGITFFSTFWIVHNLHIARRHNRRHARRAGATFPAQDYLGRTLVSRSNDELQRVPYIEVYIVEVSEESTHREHKVFHIPDGLPEKSHA